LPRVRSTRFPYTTLFRSGPADTGLVAKQQPGTDQCQTAATAQRHEFCQCVAQKTAPAAVGGGVIKRMLSAPGPKRLPSGCRRPRSEEHTSELQSRENLVC